MVKIDYPDRSIEMRDDGSIVVTYALERDYTGYDGPVTFEYRNIHDMKLDRDMFNDLLEKAGY